MLYKYTNQIAQLQVHYFSYEAPQMKFLKPLWKNTLNTYFTYHTCVYNPSETHNNCILHTRLLYVFLGVI